MSKTPSTTNTTSTTEPPAYIQPYLKEASDQARNLYASDGPQFYPGQMTVGFSQPTEQALGMQANRAMNGSDVNHAAQHNAMDTLNGSYLYGGQGFNQAVDAATRYTLPKIQSSFAGSGRYGSGLAQTAMSDAVGSAFADQYSKERDNQMRAAAMAPMLANTDYQDIDALHSVGQQVENLGQQRLDENVARYNYYQNLPETRLADYVGLLHGSYPGATTNAQQPLYKNRTAGALGGAATGASAGSYFGPWGALIGAAAGGLLGGYS